METKIHSSIVELCRGDITLQKVDAIVNAANSQLAGGGGVDGAIHAAGGPAIMQECKKIGGCATGEAVITTGGKLAARYVIHTVGPVYRNGSSDEARLLKNAYANSLKLAEAKGVKTIAFPSISTGVYGYPVEEASRIAASAVVEHFQSGTKIERVVFVLFSAYDFDVYTKTIKEINHVGL